MNFNQLEMNVSIVATVTKLVKCTEHNFPANKQIPKSSFHEEFSISIDTTHTHLISHNKTQFLFFPLVVVCVLDFGHIECRRMTTLSRFHLAHIVWKISSFHSTKKIVSDYHTSLDDIEMVQLDSM